MQAATRYGDPSKAAIRARSPMMEIIQTWTSTADLLNSESGSRSTELTFAASPTDLPPILPSVVVGTDVQRNLSTATAIGAGDPVRSVGTSTSVHHAAATSSSQAHIDGGLKGQNPVPRHTALIVLSTLGCITVVVLIWIAWHRRKRGNAELVEECQRYDSDTTTRSLTRLPNQESDLSLTGHTLVPDVNNSSTRTLEPRTEMLTLGPSHIGCQHERSSTRRPSSVIWPLRNISRPKSRRNFRPAPPPKEAYMSPTAPPSSPALATNKVSIDFPAGFAPKHAPSGIQIPSPMGG